MGDTKPLRIHDVEQPTAAMSAVEAFVDKWAISKTQRTEMIADLANVIMTVGAQIVRGATGGK